MIEFKSYPSIENSIHKKVLDYILEHRPELKTYQYILREKLDGCNIQFLFKPNQLMMVGKRTSFLTPDENFYDIWNTIKRYEDDLDKIQQYCNKQNKEIRVYGELYGQGIQKRVNYGPLKYISLFDCYIEEIPLNQVKFENWLNDLGIWHLLPPLICYCDNLEQALRFKPIFKSRVYPEAKEENLAEGVVLQPYGEGVNTRFLLKLKHPKFEEKKESEIKVPKVVNEEDKAINTLNKKFYEYINDNRLKSIFSKYGEIQNVNQIGTYIKYALEDAKADFLKDYGDSLTGFEKDNLKKVFNVGSLIANLLRKYTIIYQDEGDKNA